MKKKRKGINFLKLLSIVLMLSCLSLSVFAQENLAIITDNTQLEQIEETRRGSIAIHLDDTDNDLSQEYVEIALVKVATITSQGYELMPLFEESKVDLMGIETAEELVEASIQLEKFIPENFEVQSLKTDKNGQCVFENLEVGVYLLYPKDIAMYDRISPFLIAVPTFNIETGQMQYDINVIPKHTHNPSIRVHKVDSLDNDKVLKDAEFTLYDETMTELKVASTNEKGIAEFYNVKNGTYWIKETKAPKGYQLKSDLISVEIDEDYNGQKLFEIIIDNELLPSIQTGDEAMIEGYKIFSLISLAVLIGILVYRRKVLR